MSGSKKNPSGHWNGGGRVVARMELGVLLYSSSTEEGRRWGNGEERRRGSSGELLIDSGAEKCEEGGVCPWVMVAMHSRVRAGKWAWPGRHR